MSNRYVNTSERTTLIAKGILLYARVQNMPAAQVHGSEAQREWNSWREYHGPKMEDFVRKEQFDLFDRVNNHNWS